ncbi:hypothetical protein [Sphingomonas prati]|uniref:Uncharacterized protein n=1 Tax=Sphingomonas prati TaxID=1843237 RepID=A0A7W9BVB6_9SPHN|nr:hypothetical protein [Sphingomonas prati]MBB5730807.1 hypothetical protein [Sphingomonas prati]GGE96888.1 hypothetical protein GCM10011404_32550 [Sphingomonas prati]
MADVRLSDLTFGTICRIGITLSTCFWMPASLLLGIAGAMGAMPVEGLQRDPRGVVGFIGGALQGIGCSIIMDVVLVLGALGMVAAQRVWGDGDFDLRQRKTGASR